MTMTVSTIVNVDTKIELVLRDLQPQCMKYVFFFFLIPQSVTFSYCLENGFQESHISSKNYICYHSEYLFIHQIF